LYIIIVTVHILAKININKHFEPVTYWIKI